jgi:hypothetical protein
MKGIAAELCGGPGTRPCAEKYLGHRNIVERERKRSEEGEQKGMTYDPHIYINSKKWR